MSTVFLELKQFFANLLICPTPWKINDTEITEVCLVLFVQFFLYDVCECPINLNQLKKMNKI